MIRMEDKSVMNKHYFIFLIIYTYISTAVRIKTTDVCEDLTFSGD